MSVLLCTYNGSEHLSEQIKSYFAQSHWNWSLHVSDDGSTDGTLEILAELRRTTARVVDIEVVAGPGRGATPNFLSLICRNDVHDGYVALSDQDDIWLSHKLERAVAALEAVPEDVPAVYGSRTRVVDRGLRPIRLSPLFRRQPSFRNALVQNIAGGNTLVLNAAARRLVVAAGPDQDVVSHDWWIYLLVTGHGGRFIYDPEPGLLYRQHGRNLVGHNRSLRGLVKRFRSLHRGRYWRLIGDNLRALERSGRLLSPENRRLVAEFRALMEGPALAKPLAFHRLGLHRQAPVETGLLHLGLLTGRSGHPGAPGVPEPEPLDGRRRLT
ncbi:MAG TPA: glycosyltransferase family 2 protein [Thermohalobaculum sp.]|nr:glycosyltransferase family 2 protein [Thermohalobaculum sp.]